MKKILSVVLAVMLLMTLVAACTEQPAPAPADPATPAPVEPATPAEPDPEPEPTDETFTIGIVLGIMSNDFHSQMRVNVDEAIADAAVSHPNFTITAVNPQTPDEQLNQIETFLNQGVDILVMMPQDAALVAPLAQQAYNDGVPTIIINRRLPEGIPYTHFIAGDNVDGGRLAGEYIVDYINEHLDGQADVVAINMGSGMPIAQDRQAGFMSVAAGNPAINLLGPEEGYESGPNRESGLETMQIVLLAHPHIDIVFTHDDETALGALTAIQDAGRTDIQVMTGFGGTRVAFEMYQENDPDLILRGTSLYSPWMGYDAVFLAIDVLLGVTHSQDIIQPSVFVTPANVDEFFHLSF